MNDRRHTVQARARDFCEPNKSFQTSGLAQRGGMQLEGKRSRQFPVAGRLSLLLLILVSGMVSGCSHTYVMKLQNGTQLTTASKPKLKNGAYVYKDAMGRDQYVPAGSVREMSNFTYVELVGEMASAWLVPKFPFAEDVDVCASDTSALWPNTPAANADIVISIIESFVNRFCGAILVFIIFS